MSDKKSVFVRICAFLLALLGFQGLESCRSEYGCPRVDFTAFGDVSDPEGNPVENAEVSRNYETCLTDKDGKFCFGGSDISISDTIMLNVHAGAKYETARVVVNMVRKSDGDGHWYVGSFTSAEDVHVKLESVEEN